MNARHVRSTIRMLFAGVLILASCSGRAGSGHESIPGGANRDRGECELVIIAADARITDPSRDRRCYYRVFVDKVEAGRTDIGLESQEKVFRGRIDRNRHLVSVEKWVLDERKGRYEKLKNIEQPRPPHYYFTASGSRVVIRLAVDHETRRALFRIE